MKVAVPMDKLDLNDEDLIVYVKEYVLNGTYTTEICRKCGSCYCSPQCDVDVPKVLVMCKHCFD
jgi:hypothetical protein